MKSFKSREQEIVTLHVKIWSYDGKGHFRSQKQLINQIIMALYYILMLCVGSFLSEVHLGNFVPFGDYKYEPIWWVKHPIDFFFLLPAKSLWVWSLCPCWSIRVWDLQLKYCRFNSKIAWQIVLRYTICDFSYCINCC